MASIQQVQDFRKAPITSPIQLGYNIFTKPPDESCDWPDPQPIDAALPDVKSFNLAVLPDIFRPYVEDQADLMQIHPDSTSVSVMVSAAAAIGNRFAIAPKKLDTTWLVSPVLWGAVVGSPGMMKSPAIEKGTRPLTRIEAEMQKEFEQKLAQHTANKIIYEAQMKQAKAAASKGLPVTVQVEPEEPKPERILVNDSTAQMLGEILRHSPRGVLVLRDELVSLLESLAADGQEGARGFYLEGWNGLGSYRVDRVTRGSFIIPRFALWVLGGIQPGRLHAYVRQTVIGGNGDDGLLQRFQLIVWPDTSKTWRNVDRTPNFEASQKVEEVFLKLRHLDPVTIGAHVAPLSSRPAYLHFTSEAQEEFDAFRLKLETSLRTGDKHPALESHLAKYRSLVPALALVIHLVDGGTGPVTLEALRKALGWSDYLWSHARRVYASVTNAAAFGAKALANKITAGKLADGFTAREVQRHGWQSLTTAGDVLAALEWLLDSGWLHASRDPNDLGTGGRPTNIYNINPKVLQK